MLYSEESTFLLPPLPNIWSQSKQAYVTPTHFFLAEISRVAILQFKSDLSSRILLYFDSYTICSCFIYHLCRCIITCYIETTLYSTYKDFPLITSKKFRIYQGACMEDGPVWFCSSFPLHGPELYPL